MNRDPDIYNRLRLVERRVDSFRLPEVLPQPHAIDGTNHTVSGSEWDLVGLDGTDSLGILTPSADPGTATAILRTTSDGELTLWNLTLDQGTADGAALSFVSSDVAHGATNYAATNVYGLFKKVQNTSGGLSVRGFKDADGLAGLAVVIDGFLAEAADTTKSTAGRGIVEIAGYQTNGTALAATAANGNVVAFYTSRDGVSSVAIALLDEDGDLYVDGAGVQAYDHEDDIALLREISDVLTQERGAISVQERPRAAALGIIHPDDRGVMVSTKRYNSLLRSITLNQQKQLDRYAQMIQDLKDRIEQLERGTE